MSNNISESKEWKDLKAHCEVLKDTHLRVLFARDPSRFEKMHISIPGLVFDYSRHRITEETLTLLARLAEKARFQDWRDKFFSGQRINNTENRAVLHPALRGSVAKNLKIDGENVSDFVQQALQQVKNVSNTIRNDKNITDVVNIGIGGSDLGPCLVCEVLQDFHDGPRTHFVSNVDGAQIAALLKKLEPKHTAFIVVSKTFTTLETLTNALTAKEWAGSADNFYAVTVSASAAEKFGVPPQNILPMREWIGGRTSLWSGAGLIIAVAVGFERFKALLDGANAMDDHFLHAPLERNIPLLLGLLGIWYRNFWDFPSHAVLPYAQALQKLPAFLQQLDMESNGKSISRDEKPVPYKTGPVIFGEPGTNSQHAFMQLLHQGTEIIPADFIIIKNPNHSLSDHHRKLNANALAQAQALMQGVEKPEKIYKSFAGNKPSSTLIIERLDSWHLGMILALYEHKIFTQGIIWNINSFDQWGVELGKTLANAILGASRDSLDQTTRGLLQILEE